GRRGTEDHPRRIDARDIAKHARHELDPGECLARATQAGFALGGAVRVVERRPWRVTTRDPPEIRDGHCPGEPPVRERPRQGLDTQVWTELGPPRPASRRQRRTALSGMEDLDEGQ